VGIAGVGQGRFETPRILNGATMSAARAVIALFSETDAS
jgi:hypothetical protein